MKYSIIICPKSQSSIAIRQAFHFIQALLLDSQADQPHEIGVFFYGLAVESAFSQQNNWQIIAAQGVKLTACSTIAESYASKQVFPHFTLAGLGQWMESSIEADKHIEFV